MNTEQLFESIGEPFAAGLFAQPERCPTYRYAMAYRRFWQQAALPAYDGGRLYPCGMTLRFFEGNRNIAVVPDYSFSLDCNRPLLQEKSPEAYRIFEGEFQRLTFVTGPHTVGGAGYTHGFINYRRLLAEGLQGLEKRVEALPEDDFKEGLRITLEGIRLYHSRCLQLLKNAKADPALIAALEKVPESSPDNVYEALVSWNFMFYVDNCDNIGALDRNLLPYWKGEDITDLLRELFQHMDINNAWSGPLGSDYNGITVMAIDAVHHLHRPNLQLLVKPDMPEEVWAAVYRSLATSCGQPALHNYDLYQKSLRENIPEVSEEDWGRLCFGGCTETMLEGISYVGSDDAGINVAVIFDDYLHRILPQCRDYRTFYDGLVAEVRRVTRETLEMVNEYHRTRAQYRSQPVRTLLVDDCIENRKDFYNGGTRYIWCVANVAGLINVVESLNVLRELVFVQKKYTPEEFLQKLAEQDTDFLKNAAACPRYGVDDDRADLPAAAFAKEVYAAFAQVPCWPRGRYFPVSNQFTTYADAGKLVGATPDGRACGAPLCDSMGAIHGNDTKGPTALLKSIAKMPLAMVIGTPITNLRMKKEHLPIYLKPLVQAFFQLGGMQLQISSLSREEMLDAIAHPENHKNLVVRIGGYSEYFTRLSPELQQTVLARTEY